MKIFYEKDHYKLNSRGYTFPLLKPFIKSKSLNTDDLEIIYGVRGENFLFVDMLEDCDIAILTMSWNYYIKNGLTSLAINFITKAKELNKQVWAFNLLDTSIKFNNYGNCLLFEPGIYKSKIKDYQKVLPVFIEDPLRVFYDTNVIFRRSYNSAPIIGFCGLAKSSKINRFKELFKISFKNILSLLGISVLHKEAFLSPSYLRWRVIKELKNSKRVTTNFILRKKYRAGVSNNKHTHHTTYEFYDNIRDSDYVLCVRGAGNFSVRFYETLAMGRIPIFVNTDCGLPLDNLILWRNHLVWVEVDEIDRIESKILEFHKNLDEEKMNKLCQDNRNLWQNYLRIGGFFEKTYSGNLVKDIKF